MRDIVLYTINIDLGIIMPYGEHSCMIHINTNNIEWVIQNMVILNEHALCSHDKLEVYNRRDRFKCNVIMNCILDQHINETQR